MNCYWSYGLRKARERAEASGVLRILPGRVAEDPEYLLISAGKKKIRESDRPSEELAPIASRLPPLQGSSLPVLIHSSA